MEKELVDFIKIYEETVIPLFKEMNLASFNASLSGKEEDYQHSADLQIKLSEVYMGKEGFVKLSQIRQSEQINDEFLKRQLEILYNQFLSHQVDKHKIEEEINLQSEIENKFNCFRPKLNDKKITDNELEGILKSSINTEEVKQAWEASKQIGIEVVDDVVKLVK